jgi:hypothetical protein
MYKVLDGITYHTDIYPWQVWNFLSMKKSTLQYFDIFLTPWQDVDASVIQAMTLHFIDAKNHQGCDHGGCRSEISNDSHGASRAGSDVTHWHTWYRHLSLAFSMT